MSASTGITYALAVPQPVLPGDIVGVLLQNTQTTAQQAGPVTFGETFAAGAVQPGSTLWATIDGQKTAVQMDVKTTNPDGSVCMAVLTLQSPALAAGAQAGLMLSVGPPATPPPPISIAQLTKPGAWNFAVNLAVQNASGPPTNYTVNGATLLSQALAAGTATTILSGPQVTQVQVNEAVTSSLRVTLNISLYANGTTSTDVQFNNDAAMTATGAALTYNASITQNGKTAFSQNNITEYQYQTWDTTVASAPAPNLNIVHDTGYLEQTGAILNYDQTTGVYSSLIDANTAAMQSGTGFGILGSAGITTYMPQTGGRPDIGATTEENTMWLMTGDSNAAAYALTQADHAGSIPWHFYNPTTGNYTNTDDYPTLWTDPRGGSSGTVGLTQQAQDYNSATDPGNGWAIDTDHAPDLDYDAYLMTGNQYYLDQLNAEANESILYLWPATRGTDIVVTAGQQVRGQAWDLRAIGEAAYANPNGSAEKSYFTQVLSDNLSALVAELPTLTAEQGQSYGWIPGVYGSDNTSMAPWQQDYFASTIVALAERGNAQAVQILQWEQNFLVGRFLSAAQGFDPNNGAAYNLVIGTNTQWFTSWAQIEAGTEAAGESNGTGWSWSEGDYAQLALQSLAGSITVLESADAIKAYGWLIAYGPQDYIGGTANANAPDFNVVPRLSDGQLLTGNNVYVLADTTNGVIQGGNVDQLISETGSANVVLRGGTGMNLLFAGSGNDWLIGGAGNDYLFGGAGHVTVEGGAGSNYLDAGAGAANFVFTTTDNATDVIADFQIGTDLLDVLGPTGALLTTSATAALITGATSDSNGDAVLHLSATHTLTLMGIRPSQLTTALFATIAPGTAPSGKITQTSSLTSWGTASPGGGSGGGGGTGGGSLTITGASGTMNLSQSYYDITGDDQPLVVADNAGRSTVTGGSGGLTFSTTVGADVITTVADSANTITLALSSAVYSNGIDTINGGTGNSTFIVTGNAVVNGSTGNSSYQLAGDDVMSSFGVDTINANSGASVTLSVADLGILSEQSATLAIRSDGLRVATVSGGMGSLTVFAGSQVLQATIGGGVGSTHLSLGHFATVVQSGGSDTVTGGGGAATINASGYLHMKVGGGAISLNASSGMASVIGGNGAFTFSGNAGLNFIGSAGASNFTLGSGVSVITAGSGNVSLMGGTGAIEFTSGVGHANLTIGAGSVVDLQGAGTVAINGASWGLGTIYDLMASTGNAVDTIDNYRPGTDHLQFTGCGIASQSQAGGSLNLSLTDGTTVILPGVSHL